MKCDCNMCNTDFSSDNGYEYVLEELKATRDHIDNVISIIEKRMEKDALIDKVLNSNDYEDKKEAVDKQSETALDAVIKAIAIQNAMQPFNTTSRIKSPYWSIFPKNYRYHNYF